MVYIWLFIYLWLYRKGVVLADKTLIKTEKPITWPSCYFIFFGFYLNTGFLNPQHLSLIVLAKNQKSFNNLEIKSKVRNRLLANVYYYQYNLCLCCSSIKIFVLYTYNLSLLGMITKGIHRKSDQYCTMYISQFFFF